jgi:predicted ATPase
MLKSWYIQNFKPILDSGELKLAPVTILAGRNSSGKSSLIQSILMIAQTLSNRVLDRALLPNGPIVQLGTFEDILSEQTNLRTLMVGFELEMEKEKLQTPTNAHIRLDNGRLISGPNTSIESVRITSLFHSSSSNSASAIEAAKVNVENVELDIAVSQFYDRPQVITNYVSKAQTDFTMVIKRLSSVKLDEFLDGISSDYLRLVPYANKDLNYLGIFTLKNEQAITSLPKSSLVAFSHFLPTRLIEKYSIEERQKLQLLQAVDWALRYKGNISLLFKNLIDILDPSIVFQDNLREALLDICKEENISEAFSGRTLNDFIIWYRSLKLIQEKISITHKFEEIIVQGILEQSSRLEKNTEALETVANNIYLDFVIEAVEQTNRFFTSQIRYLGPLRASPQSVQKIATSGELDDVGAKGEYAAAVYDANQNAVIQWYNPSTNATEENTLKEALTTWVRHLGIADEIKTQDAGQSGVSWQVVNIKGRKALPLSAVGVGVSQILPILVMGLLAPSNTLLIVEQPELHLHPSVQARLGDFFMGLAKCSKQCLIETHSENLVSQLRLHIVEAGGQENADCLIYFVDQDEQGATQFNPIEISPKGNIMNWPDGFLDETMLQEDRITAAGLKKKAKK